MGALNIQHVGLKHDIRHCIHCFAASPFRAIGVRIELYTFVHVSVGIPIRVREYQGWQAHGELGAIDNA